MNRHTRQLVRDGALAFLVVMAVLALQGELDRSKHPKQLAEAYKRGVSIGIMAGRADRLGPDEQTQLIEICNKTWPDTREGTEVRRRACGTLAPAKRVDQ